MLCTTARRFFDRCDNSCMTNSRWFSWRLRVATSALSAKLGTEMLIMNASRRRKESLRLLRAKGPPTEAVPHTAKHARISEVVAVSRWLRRSAAHISGKTAKKANGALFAVCSISGLKAIRPTTMAVPKTAQDCIHSCRTEDRVKVVVHSKITGVMTSAPAKSPIHHVIHIDAKSTQSA